MAYIYKKIIHEKPYYYLRVSKRLKGKIIVKDIAYLGSDVEKIKENLDNLPKKEVRSAYKNITKFLQSEYYLKKVKNLKLKENPYIDKKLLEEIEAINLHFNNHFMKLDKKTIEETYKNFIIDFAFNTTSLEGNTITLSETNKLLRENLTPKNRTLMEIYDLKNTETVFFNILEMKKEIDHDFIVSMHDELLKNIDEREGYRRHDIRVFGARFRASPFIYIKADIDNLLKWSKDANFHPFVLASIFHHKFEKIHPFADGNGRTGRMLMNYILLQAKYPAFSVRKSRRGDYLDAMGLADKAEKTDPKYYKKLVNYLAEEMIHSYWNNFLI